MRSIPIYILLTAIFFSSTGMVLIDTQTKQNVEALNAKYDKLLNQESVHHAELLQFLKGLQEMVAKKSTVQVIAPPPQQAKPEPAKITPQPAALVPSTPAIVSTPVLSTPLPSSPTTATVTQPTMPSPAATPPATISQPSPIVPMATATPAPTTQTPENVSTPTLPTTPLTITAPPAQPIPFPTAPPPVSPMPSHSTAPSKVEAPKPSATLTREPAPIVQVTIPKEVIAKLEASHSASHWALFVSIVSLIGMVVLIFTVRRNEEGLRKIVWKSEMASLKTEVTAGRPQLKVENSYDRLLLTNIGTITADEIKLSLGPAPTTMQQKLRIMSKIHANEKAEVEIGAQVGGSLYGKLEYKNPQNGKIFKDQFVVKVDGVTGEFVPIQQAC